MNDGELIGKVHSAMYHQCQNRGYAAPVEAVCTVNLRKLSFIMHQMRVYAKKSSLKPSFCYYKRWGMKKKNGQGHKPVVPLRFSKSGAPDIERWYGTHFVDSKRIEQLKAGAEMPFDGRTRQGKELNHE